VMKLEDAMATHRQQQGTVKIVDGVRGGTHNAQRRRRAKKATRRTLPCNMPTGNSVGRVQKTGTRVEHKGHR